VWDSDKKKYVVKAIRETSRIEARKVAIELARDGTQSRKPIERQFTFEHFATKALVNHKALVDDGQRNIGIVKAIEWALQNSEWGLVKRFGAKDIRKIKTRDYDEYMTELTKRRPDLSSSSKNSIMSAFRNVLKVARDEGVIDDLPATPRAKQQDNPRPFFSILSCSRKEE
jgi:hypothetical protein